VIGRNVPLRVRLVKGSHIVVDKLFDHDRSYIFQNADHRICFAIPYEQDFTLIGTTDEDYWGDPSEVAITDGEIAYLLGSVNEYFSTPVRREQIRWSYAGVRPLHDDGTNKAQEATRDYALKLDRDAGGGPVLSIFGGKITTYRKLAEHAVDMLSDRFPQMGKAWTESAPLPGGNFAVDDTQNQIEEIVRKIPNMPIKQAERLFRCYGTRYARFLQHATKIEDLGEDFGHGLTQREVDYLIAEEWASSVEDILWRRTKLGLKLDAAQVRRLQFYMTGNKTQAPGPARYSASSGA
jgi:glycerol-3-phosphate dehydrogenase